MSGPGFAVLDFETTGLFPGGHDRVVEVAVVHVADDGHVTGRWDTLVNPQRDLGAQRIHGIRAADVLDAPTFSDILPGLVELLDERVLVAHNASFDTRFLLAELDRARYHADLPLVSLCTMQLARDLLPGAGRSLADCCAAFDIDLVDAHRASVDALATAQLLDAYMASTGSREFWYRYIDEGLRHHWQHVSTSPAIDAVWLPRGSTAHTDPTAFLQRVAERMPAAVGPAGHDNYLALLDRCMLDGVLSVHEANSLVRLAGELGIDRETCRTLHDDYFTALVTTAWSDGVLTSDEVAQLAAVARLLDVPGDRLTAALQQPVPSASAGDLPRSSAADASGNETQTRFGTFALRSGDQIVLTGEMSRSRGEWERELRARGYLPKPAVTKTIALVVAADPDSLSGKAHKARQYGIPIVDETGLERLLR